MAIVLQCRQIAGIALETRLIASLTPDFPDENSVQQHGRALLAKVRAIQAQRSLEQNIENRLLDFTRSQPGMFRKLVQFIDVYPVIQHNDALLLDYFTAFFGQAGHLGKLWNLAAQWSDPRTLATQIRSQIESMARRFVPAASLEELMASLQALQAQSLAWTADLMGEDILSEDAANAYVRRTCAQINLVSTLKDPNVSIKPSALACGLDPIDPGGPAMEKARERFRIILRNGIRHGVFVNMDMEDYVHQHVYRKIFMDVLMEDEFRACTRVGIALQAEYENAHSLCDELLEYARKRSTAFTIRLVKGAYHDLEILWALQEGRAVPVSRIQAETDARFEALTLKLLANHALVRSALGTHNPRSAIVALCIAKDLQLPAEAFELQVLYGMGESLAQALREQAAHMGYPQLTVRMYTGYGKLADYLRYLMRRMQESTAAGSAMMKLEYSPEQDDAVLRKPETARRRIGETAQKDREAVDSPTHRLADSIQTRFWNIFTLHWWLQHIVQWILGSPASAKAQVAHADLPTGVYSLIGTALQDFKPTPREAWHDPQVHGPYFEALRALRQALSQKPYAATLVLGDREIPVEQRETVPCYSPNDPSLVLGYVALARPEDVDLAVETAAADVAGWGRRSLQERVAVLQKLHGLLLENKWSLMQLCQLGLGKTAREADGDIGEGIDFVDFYARDALDRGNQIPLLKFPGESTSQHIHPLGVVAVLSPFNFVAIPIGMLAAALVMGNRVVLKASERNMLVVRAVAEYFYQAGVPRTALQILQANRSSGRDIGERLVSNSRVQLINFTGSERAGNAIHEIIARQTPTQRAQKQLMAEMGGKNVIVVDHDADIDLALAAAVQSCFGYGGQKCSAASRILVHENLREVFLQRFKAAVLSLRVANPVDDPSASYGPLIDAEHAATVIRWKDQASQDGKILVGPADWQILNKQDHQNYVLPMVVYDVSKDSQTYSEEIFGPVVCVNFFSDLDQALADANHSRFDLTAGYYGRHPQAIERVMQELHSGMLYINRKGGITGARVGSDGFHAGLSASGVGLVGAPGAPGHILRFVYLTTVNQSSTVGSMVDPDVLA